jgi:lysozyme
MNLAEQLKRDEGEVLNVYLDSKGIRTAGVGHNLEAHGINWPVGTMILQEQSDQWLQQDIDEAATLLARNLPWTENLDAVRLAVLENMIFNMGWSNADGTHGLCTFHHTLTMIEAGNYDGASAAMLESEWARQVGPRANRLSEQMRSGEWV